MKHAVKVNGLIVAEYEPTGDPRRDIELAREAAAKNGVTIPEQSQADAAFAQAVAFCTTAAILRDALERRENVTANAVPFVVNASFSMELYLKALALKHGSPIKGHELLTVYDKLPSPALTAIAVAREKVLARTSIVGTTVIRDIMASINNAFVEWRYSYEKGDAPPFHHQQAVFALEVLHHSYIDAPPAAQQPKGA